MHEKIKSAGTCSSKSLNKQMGEKNSSGNNN